MFAHYASCNEYEINHLKKTYLVEIYVSWNCIYVL